MPVAYSQHSQQRFPASRGCRLPLVRGSWPVSSSTCRFRDPDGSHSSAPNLDGCKSRRCIFRVEATRRWKKQTWRRDPSPSRTALVLSFLSPSSAGSRVTGERTRQERGMGRSRSGAVVLHALRIFTRNLCFTTDLTSSEGGQRFSQHLSPLQSATGWPSHPRFLGKANDTLFS